MTRSNFRRNTALPEIPETGEMINGQGVGAVSKLRYGICHMSFNGCEVIAVHNALVYLGIPRPITEIARYMERFRVLIGFFGCNVFRLGKALSHFGASFTRAKTPGNAKAFIISFWTKRPLISSVHTVFCIREEKGIMVHNIYNSCPVPKMRDDLEALIGNHRPIAVYIIEESCSEQ